MSENYKPTRPFLPPAALAVATGALCTNGGIAFSSTSAASAASALVGASALGGPPAWIGALVAAGAILSLRLITHKAASLMAAANEHDSPEPRPVIRETKNGNTTIYHIHSLNVYLNAELVQQMNVNPQNVVNTAVDSAMAKLGEAGNKHE